MVRLLALKKELLFLALVLTYKTGIVGGAHGDEGGGEKQQQAVKINPRDKPELIKNTQSILPLPSKAKMLVWERKDHEANTDQIIKAYTKTFLTTKPLDQFEIVSNGDKLSMRNYAKNVLNVGFYFRSLLTDYYPHEEVKRNPLLKASEATGQSLKKISEAAGGFFIGKNKGNVPETYGEKMEREAREKEKNENTARGEIKKMYFWLVEEAMHGRIQFDKIDQKEMFKRNENLESPTTIEIAKRAMKEDALKLIRQNVRDELFKVAKRMVDNLVELVRAERVDAKLDIEERGKADQGLKDFYEYVEKEVKKMMKNQQDHMAAIIAHERPSPPR